MHKIHSIYYAIVNYDIKKTKELSLNTEKIKLFYATIYKNLYTGTFASR